MISGFFFSSILTISKLNTCSSDHVCCMMTKVGIFDSAISSFNDLFNMLSLSECRYDQSCCFFYFGANDMLRNTLIYILLFFFRLIARQAPLPMKTVTLFWMLVTQVFEHLLNMHTSISMQNVVSYLRLRCL